MENAARRARRRGAGKNVCLRRRAASRQGWTRSGGGGAASRRTTTKSLEDDSFMISHAAMARRDPAAPRGSWLCVYQMHRATCDSTAGQPDALRGATRSARGRGAGPARVCSVLPSRSRLSCSAGRQARQACAAGRFASPVRVRCGAAVRCPPSCVWDLFACLVCLEVLRHTLPGSVQKRRPVAAFPRCSAGCFVPAITE